MICSLYGNNSKALFETNSSISHTCIVLPKKGPRSIIPIIHNNENTLNTCIMLNDDTPEVNYFM